MLFKTKVCLGFLTLTTLFFASCQVQRVPHKNTPQAVIQNMIDTSKVFSSGFTGLVIENVKDNKKWVEINAHKHFVPASNTKLYTLFACLTTLGDSLPALRYLQKNDTLTIWGTSDPTFLHPDFPTNHTLQFLKRNSAKYLALSDANFQNQANGNGWMWDDYNDNYQVELSPLPIYGNIVRFSVANGIPAVNPSIFQNTFIISPKKLNEVKRVQFDNQFLVSKNLLESADYKQDIPIKTSLALTQQLLIDTLKQNIILTKNSLSANAKTLYSLPVDTVYRRMMYISDNMVAEHLLQAVSASKLDTIKTPQLIEVLKASTFSDLPDTFTWVDGSGLSRYNSFTPANTIVLLKKMFNLVPQERLFSLLAANGRAGTMKTMFVADKPYIFAKSGSMGGVYNLSGYLITKKQQVVAFSFMNNLFSGSISQTRKEVEKVLTKFYELY